MEWVVREGCRCCHDVVGFAELEIAIVGGVRIPLAKMCPSASGLQGFNVNVDEVLEAGLQRENF